MHPKHFIDLNDWSSDALRDILATCLNLKSETKAGQRHTYLKDRNIGMVFDKASLRTQVSFEVGINQLGGKAINLGTSAGKLGEREPISDFARVVSRYVDGLVVRTFEEDRIYKITHFTDIPIINALTDQSHPCQAMGDLFTLIEHFGSLEGISLAYVGDSNNVAHSLLKAAAKLGLRMRVASPAGYEFSNEIMSWGKDLGFSFHQDPREAVEGVQVLYTDVWTSMGQEKEKEQRIKDFQGFQLNNELLALAASNAKVMHCLPAHRGEEISEAVMESDRSIVFDQAENRLHIQKAVLVTLFKDRPL